MSFCSWEQVTRDWQKYVRYCQMLNLLPLNLWDFLQAEYTKDLMSLLISEFQIPAFYFPKLNHLSSLLPETCYLSLRTSPLTFYHLFHPLQRFPGFSHCLSNVLPRGCTICRDRAMREEEKQRHLLNTDRIQGLKEQVRVPDKWSGFLSTKLKHSSLGLIFHLKSVR